MRCVALRSSGSVWPSVRQSPPFCWGYCASPRVLVSVVLYRFFMGRAGGWQLGPEICPFSLSFPEFGRGLTLCPILFNIFLFLDFLGASACQQNYTFPLWSFNLLFFCSAIAFSRTHFFSGVHVIFRGLSGLNRFFLQSQNWPNTTYWYVLLANYGRKETFLHVQSHQEHITPVQKQTELGTVTKKVSILAMHFDTETCVLLFGVDADEQRAPV